MAPNPTTPQHQLCPQCGHRIITAVRPDGGVIALDTGLRVYRLVLTEDNQAYRAEPQLGSGYVVHACRGKEG